MNSSSVSGIIFKEFVDLSLGTLLIGGTRPRVTVTNETEIGR